MSVLALKPNRNIVLISIIAIAIFAGGAGAIHLVPLAARGKIANGLLADFMITFPVSYYLIVLRPQKKSAKGLLLIFSICCALAYIILPQQQRDYILQIRKLSILVELAFVIYVISRFNKIRASYKTQQLKFADPVYNLRFAMAEVLGNSLPVKALSTELAVLRYGILFWKKEKPQQNESLVFTTHKDSGYIGMWCVLFFVMLIEMIAIHMLLLKWSNIAATIITSLTAYTLVLFTADLSAIVKRKVIISNDLVALRTGLRWRITTTLDNISSIQKIANDYHSDTEYLKGGILKSSGNVVINFKTPVKIEKLYGKNREVNSILMNIDDVDSFISQCAIHGAVN